MLRYKDLKKMKLADTPLGSVAIDDPNGVLTSFYVEEYKGGFYRVVIYCGYINVLCIDYRSFGEIVDNNLDKRTSYRSFTFSTHIDWDKKDSPIDFSLYFFETKGKPFIGDLMFWERSYKRSIELSFFKLDDDCVTEYEAHKPNNARESGKLKTGKRWKLDSLVTATNDK